MSNKLFATAAQKKLRFTTARGGHLSTEDLFDLSLKDLDKMGREIRSGLREVDEDSLLENPDKKESAATAEDRLRFEIIKEVIGIRQAQNKAKRLAQARKQRAELLKGLRDKKELASLEDMSLDDLDKEIADLEGTPLPVTEAADEDTTPTAGAEGAFGAQ